MAKTWNPHGMYVFARNLQLPLTSNKRGCSAYPVKRAYTRPTTRLREHGRLVIPAPIDGRANYIAPALIGATHRTQKNFGFVLQQMSATLASLWFGVQLRTRRRESSKVDTEHREDIVRESPVQLTARFVAKYQ